MYENRLMGVPRVRQIRVRDDSCAVYPDFKQAVIKCYAPYSPMYEDKTGIKQLNKTKNLAE
jgi:polycystin 2